MKAIYGKGVERADAALQTYLDVEGDDVSAVDDLLTDLRHWCDARGIDFDKMNEIARQNYEDERDEGEEGEEGTRRFAVGDRVRVNAPGEYENAFLNGWTGVVSSLAADDRLDAVTVELDEGKALWQFMPAHLERITEGG